jgi:pentatricopeptide repeat protein
MGWNQQVLGSTLAPSTWAGTSSVLGSTLAPGSPPPRVLWAWQQEACTFDRLVQVLARSKQSVQAGWAVLEAMHAGGEAVCVPAVNVVLAAQARTRDMDAVFDTFLALSARLCLQPTTAVYNTLMEACWRCGRAEVVLLLRDEMLQKGLLPNAVRPCRLS